MATIEELKQEVLDHQFSASRYGTRIIKYFAKAQDYMASQTNFPGFLTLVQDTLDIGIYDYDLPADYNRIKTIDVFPQNGTQADKLDQMSLEGFITAPDSTGAPQFYIIRNDVQFSVYPAPDSQYNIDFYYYRNSTAITETTDAEIPQQYESLLVDYALYRCYLSEHDDKFAVIHKNLFEEGIRQMKNEVQGSDKEGPEVVPGTWYNTGAL